MNYKNNLQNIKLVLFDVDGVMTDGSIYITENGESIKKFNVKDGLAIELLRCHGIYTGVVSGKASSALSLRCKSLGFDFVVTGCKNKLPKVIEICNSLNITLGEMSFCGDDVLDIPVMKPCGISFAPANSHQLVLETADHVLSCRGGEGAVREIADIILLSKFPSLKEVYRPLLVKIEADDVASLEQ